MLLKGCLMQPTEPEKPLSYTLTLNYFSFMLLTAYDEMSVWEKAFSLHQSSGVSGMKHVKNPISIHAHCTAC